ncbi:MAG: cytochrome b/b6 domain-containing protein [Planctomycetota bacterium]|nr:cytochrome b/b6 domain-containing protein [Planctomycetota bacterium]
MRFRCVMAAAFGLARCVAGGQACTECHGGQDKNAPVVSVTPASTHAGLECDECHTGVKQPCHKGMRVAQCKTCHSDQATALNGATHAEKLKKCLAKDGEVKPMAVCMSCHGTDVHNLRKVKDAAGPASRGNVSTMCLKCHEKEQHIAVGRYTSSVHGLAMANGKTKAAECADCHGSHAIDHSQRLSSKVFRTNIPQTCGHCHPEEKKQYEASTHWASASKGYHEPPVCTDCHGEHSIRSSQDVTSPTFAGNVTKTCAACHASEKITAKFMLQADRVKSFRDSFHGLSGELGDLRAANCASCHGNHMILPSSDSRSSVYPANLGHTCGNCHPGADTRFSNARIHTTTERPSHWTVAAVRVIYIWLIILTIGGMLIHNLLDILYKATRGLPYHRQPGLAPRFSVNERIQHALLALSFILLAVSGFALKFPDSVFAWPFQQFSAGPEVRRWIHRGCAGVFVLLAAYHLLYLLASARGRAQRKALWPSLQDVRDVKSVLLRYLRRSNAELQLPAFAYTEKAEYWALVWGGTVMTVTGLVLLFVNLSLSNLPLWAVDLARTIHYWEAVLAALAILVWHGYWVVLDPEHYPLNLTWLIGDPRPPTNSVAAAAPAAQQPAAEKANQGGGAPATE